MPSQSTEINIEVHNPLIVGGNVLFLFKVQRKKFLYIFVENRIVENNFFSILYFSRSVLEEWQILDTATGRVKRFLRCFLLILR